MRLRSRADGGVTVIAAGVGVGTFAMYFWMPFAPLYLKELGAASDADALAWATVALTGLGISRVVVAPIWGILSDRFGRKLMFVRGLVFASGTTIIAAFATEPWHLALAYTTQGLLSGFVPAATALTSVSTPEAKLGSSLGMVNGAQYVGTTLGPVVGAVLAATFGLRGAIVVAGIIPAALAVLVVVLVPRDRPGVRGPSGNGRQAASFWSAARIRQAAAAVATVPVGFGLLVLFLTFATGQAVRVTLPLLLAGMVDPGDVEAAVGLVFTVGGATSVLGVILAGRRLARPGVLVRGLVIACLISAVAYVLFAASASLWTFIAAFAIVSVAQGAMLPGANTVIATAVPRDRRGTVFGLAATAQAFAFMIGPLAATAVASMSYQLGFAIAAIVFVLVAALLRWRLPEPVPAGAARESGAPVLAAGSLDEPGAAPPRCARGPTRPRRTTGRRRR